MHVIEASTGRNGRRSQMVIDKRINTPSPHNQLFLKTSTIKNAINIGFILGSAITILYIYHASKTNTSESLFFTPRVSHRRRIGANLNIARMVDDNSPGTNHLRFKSHPIGNSTSEFDSFMLHWGAT